MNIVKLSKKKKKKNIYFSNSKNNYNTNIMCKHRGGFPEGLSPIMLDTLSNAEYNIKYFFKNKKNTKKQFTILYTFIALTGVDALISILNDNK